MKFVLSLLALGVCAQAQWITGFYAAQNGVLPVSSIPWNKYSHIIHFAAAPNGNGSVNMLYLIQAEINSLVSSRPAGKKVLVCIKDNHNDLGAFGQATSPATIGTFVNNIANFVNSNQYDGVDLDWESNVNVTQYRDLIIRLRQAMPNKLITMDGGNWSGIETAAGGAYSSLDQVNVMCYDMDHPGNGYSWHNDALLQNGNPLVMTCDWRIRSFTNAGVPKSKIGIGIPYYGRKWQGVSLPYINGSFTNSTVFYRDLATDGQRWQASNQRYDSGYKANYLSIPSLNEFVSYNGVESINDTVAWQKSQGFGGFMTFTVEYEYIGSRSGDARFPLSTALYSAVFGSGGGTTTVINPGPTVSSGAPTGTLGSGTTSTTISVATNVNAQCRYSTSAGTAYSSMPSTFASTGGTSHSTTVGGLQPNTTYRYYVRCIDNSGNANQSDYAITFSVAAQTVSSNAPRLYQITPSSGTGSSQQFVLRFSDADGYATIQQIDVVFDTTLGKANSCAVEYWAPTRTVFLRSNDNATWTQAALGSGTTLQNSQCSISIPQSSSSGAGTSLDLTLGLSFASGFTGTKNIYVFVADQSNLNSSWQTAGTWTVPTATAAPAPSSPISSQLTPSSGSGMMNQFTMNVTHSGGYSAVRQVALFIGDYLGASYSCHIEIFVPTKTVSLRSNTNVSWSSGTAGSVNLLQNTQCAIYLRDVTITGSGNTLTVKVTPLFKTRFRGQRQIYTFAGDGPGNNTGWKNTGTWNVQ